MNLENQENRPLGPLTEGKTLPKVTQYLVTIKLHKMDHTTKEELDAELAELKTRVKNADWSNICAYETDTLHRMHLHTYCIITGKAPYFKKLQKPGMSIDFRTNRQSSGKKILKYIHKFDQSPAAVHNRFVINEHYWTVINVKKYAFTEHGIKLSM